MRLRLRGNLKQSCQEKEDCQEVENNQGSFINETANDFKKTDFSQSDKVSFFDNADAEIRIKEFIKEIPLAKEYLKDIIGVISKDDDIAVASNCLGLAFCKVVENKLNAVESNESLERYALSRQEIKDRVIEEYLKNILNNAPPKVIDSNGFMSITKTVMPTTLEEAGAMAKCLLRGNL